MRPFFLHMPASPRPVGALLISILLACSGCSQKSHFAEIGAIGGTILGIYLGSKVGNGLGRNLAMTAGGALGGLAGYYLGHKLDARDKEEIAKASSKAVDAEIGEEITWENPASGHHGSVMPIQEKILSSGHKCRTFHRKIVIDDELENRQSLACRADNGDWYVLQDDPVDPPPVAS